MSQEFKSAKARDMQKQTVSRIDNDFKRDQEKRFFSMPDSFRRWEVHKPIWSSNGKLSPIDYEALREWR